MALGDEDRGPFAKWHSEMAAALEEGPVGHSARARGMTNAEGMLNTPKKPPTMAERLQVRLNHIREEEKVLVKAIEVLTRDKGMEIVMEEILRLKGLF